MTEPANLPTLSKHVFPSLLSTSDTSWTCQGPSALEFMIIIKHHREAPHFADPDSNLDLFWPSEHSTASGVIPRVYDLEISDWRFST